MNGKRSSVHLRTLSKLGVDLERDVQNLDISSAIPGTSEKQAVTGLSGRMRLQKAPEAKASGNWMDKQRQYLQAYEYLCHIGEAKEWIEGCLNEAIPAIVDLEEQLRNGVVLARLAKVFVPRLVPRIFEAPRLQFRHSDNINRFFKFVDYIDLPENFRFELTDLYEKKNIPKVIYCIHALSFVLANSGQARQIGDLVGKLQFTEDELLQTQRSLDATGVSLPNFKGVGSVLSGEAAQIEAQTVEEDPQDRVDRECIENAPMITLMQAKARGALLRQRITAEFARLAHLEIAVTKLQSAGRGYLLRRQYYENAHTYRQINDWITSVQAFSQGFLTRNRLNFRDTALSVNTIPLIRFQALSRGYLSRRVFFNRTKDLTALCEPAAIIALQSLLRAYLVRSMLNDRDEQLVRGDHHIERLQAVCRGKLQRSVYHDIHNSTKLHAREMIALQACCGATLVRKSLRGRMDALARASNNITQVQGLARGGQMRSKCRLLLSLLAYEEASVIDSQASCRGMLVRIDHNAKLIALARLERLIVGTQALARGCAQRLRFHARLQHYRRNMEQVIKVQSFVRARQQGSAYKSLILDQNPPISTIKSFIHLLNDSNFDFEEEVAVEQARKQVVHMIRENEAAEEHIEQMDIKIALLVKQAIKIDEVIQHQRRMDKGFDTFSSNTGMFDLKALNKQARSQLENYQKFFYVLQTQPVYLARLFATLDRPGSSEKDLKKLESLVMVLYGYAQKKREEYFLLKLVRSSVIKEISQAERVEDFLHINSYWNRLLNSYLKSPKEHQFLQDLLRPLVQVVVEDDFMDLESDPVAIYDTLRRDEESRTGQPSSRPANVTQEFAITDPDTRMMFIKHLRDLRDLTERLLQALQTSVHKMPFGVRYIAREAYRAMQEHLGNATPLELHQILGHLVFEQYIIPALSASDRHGLADFEVRTTARRNLTEICNMLHQIAAGRLFDNGSYLQPLNEFIAKSLDRITDIFGRILDTEDIEIQYGITDLDDVVATKHPTLYIKASDIFSMHSLVYQNVRHVAPESEDALHHVLQDLGTPPTRAEDMMLMSITNSEIALTLDPKAIDLEDPEADERALFIQTKRYVLYIIRVQSGPSLLDILVETVSETDELRWQEVRYSEDAETRQRGSQIYSERSTLNISRMSYAALKRECLHSIVRLEQLGWISRNNRYQELLNSIADDIKSQNRRRIERQRDLSSTRATLGNLSGKREYLNAQLKSYNDYIEQAMLSLHSKKNKRKSILPFSKQYFHMRDLQKAGKVPKFGSRKYSAAKLYEKGVLVSIVNEIPPFDKAEITISSDQIGVFTLVSSSSDSARESTIVQLEELLQAQYNKSEIVDVFAGRMKIRVAPMLNLVFKHFFSQ